MALYWSEGISEGICLKTMAAYYTAFWACSLEHFFFVLEMVNELKPSLSSSSIESQVTGK